MGETFKEVIGMTKDPLENLPEVTSFGVEATDVNSDGTFTEVQYSGKMGVEGGKDVSPALNFSNVPEGTKSFIVQVYDPDARLLQVFGTGR